MKSQADQLEVANRVLAEFTSARIERRRGGFYILWHERGKEVCKRYVCRGGSFYPMWRFPFGGTATQALAQLIRWMRGDPVLPLSVWVNWSRENYKLCSPEVVDMLLDGGYPERSPCVLCGGDLPPYFDWWSLDGVSGPCCNMRNGCRQKGVQE